MARAHYLRGQVHAAAGDLDAAEESLSRARIFDADEPRIMMALGSVAMTRGDMNLARDRMGKAAQLAPDRAHPWLVHGRLELAFGDKDVGRSALHKAMNLGDPWQARAALIADDLRGGSKGTMPDLLLEWSQAPLDDNTALRRRGDLRLMAGDAKGAVDDYFLALERAGWDESLVTPLIRAATVGRQVAHTLMSADRLIENDPTAAAPWMVTGLLSSLVGDHAQTIRALQTAELLGIQLGSGARMALQQASVAVKQGEQAESPARPPALGDPISQALGLMADHRYDECEALLHARLRDTPGDPRLLYIMAQVHLERDGPMASTPWIEQVLELKSDFAPALNLWAWVHAEQSLDLKKAESRALEALEHQPHIGGYWDTLGWVLFKQGRYGDALPILDRAVRLSPKDDAVRAHRDSCRAMHVEAHR